MDPLVSGAIRESGRDIKAALIDLTQALLALGAANLIASGQISHNQAQILISKHWPEVANEL